jgi:hypothetical protein
MGSKTFLKSWTNHRRHCQLKASVTCNKLQNMRWAGADFSKFHFLCVASLSFSLYIISRNPKFNKEIWHSLQMHCICYSLNYHEGRNKFCKWPGLIQVLSHLMALRKKTTVRISTFPICKPLICSPYLWLDCGCISNISIDRISDFI